MRLYLASLAVGLLVGVIYGLLDVRSPAPPVVALLGLLGILAGEQLPPLVRHALRHGVGVHAWRQQVQPHVFGQLPRATRPHETDFASNPASSKE